MKPSLRLSQVQLRVSNLDRSLHFYTQQLGFVVATRESGRAVLATGPDAPGLLELTAVAAAPPAAPEAAGLFHAALLLPSRAALGAWLQFAAGQAVAFAGFSDHGVSEALYLSDPDGNGLEFYADRPAEAWPRADGAIAMTSLPLDWRELVAVAAQPAAGPLAGAAWGHLHLRVTDLDRSEAFYAEQLGLGVTQRSYPGARFMAADGYHHHLALNTWGRPRRPHPPNTLGLKNAVFTCAGVAAPRALHDPDGIALTLAPG